MAVLVFIGDISFFLWKIDFVNYISTLRNGSSFIEDNYVSPASVDIEFPQKKRNLIYIYLESMEVSYADKAHGGFFDYNIIPEMCELAKEGENFSGDKATLNGGYSLPGTDWTVAGIIAQTAGLPIQVEIGARGSYFQSSYYHEVVSLGDILEKNGYRQYFMCGSDASFAGKKEYLIAHGNYEIDDYSYAVERGWFDESKKSDWGYKDKYLFEYARKRLLEVAQDETPFNFTLLTVDTHFSGQSCDLCLNEFDQVTENIYACSNRQLTEFVKWIQEQDFYDDTTIVICGDHTTMDPTIGDIIGSEYPRRTYTLYLNSLAEASDPLSNRIYTTMDLFPTTLVSLGVNVVGNRLGLGTNLFSREPTVSEQVGIETERQELKKYSPFLSKLSGVNVSEMVTKEEEEAPYADTSVKLNEEEEFIDITVSNLSGNIRPFLFDIVLNYYSGGNRENEKVIKMKKSNGVFSYKLPTEGLNLSDLDINIYYDEIFGDKYQIFGQNGDARLKSKDFIEYIDSLKEYASNPDYAILMIALKHRAMNCLTEEQLSKLRELGLRVEMKEGEYKSYCAVIQPNDIIERISDEREELTGKLSSGEEYFLRSDWTAEKSGICSLAIDGNDYTMETTGLLIVVYDKTNSKVADRVCFNNFMNRVIRREEFDRN